MTGSRPTARRVGSRRRLAVLVALVVLPVASGCSAHNALGTSNSPCYVALPAAEAAVHHQGHLMGLKLVTVSSLSSFPRLYGVADTTTAAGTPVTKVCLAGFIGRFTYSNVEQPVGPPHGKVAVAVLTYQGNQLLGTVLYRHVPVRFGHSHVL